MAVTLERGNDQNQFFLHFFLILTYSKAAPVEPQILHPLFNSRQEARMSSIPSGFPQKMIVLLLATLAAPSWAATANINSVQLKTNPASGYQYLSIVGSGLKDTGNTAVTLGGAALALGSQSASTVNFYCPSDGVSRTCPVGDWKVQVTTYTNASPPVAVSSVVWNLTVGAVGAQGPQGPKGDAGAVGPKGDTGAAGPKGDVGPQGAKGDAGAIGPQGATGPVGLAWQGTWAMAKAYKVNDAVYFSGASYRAVVAIAANGAQPSPSKTTPWTLVAMQGAVGVKGDAGPAGAKGDPGPQGSKGDTGTVGVQGATGPQGNPGPQGAKGDTGAAGAQGPAGVAGLNWLGNWNLASAYQINDAVYFQGSSFRAVAAIPANGAQPDTGRSTPWALLALQGAQGSTGSKGDTGAVGPTGSQGPQGPIGPAGPQGPAGQLTGYWSPSAADSSCFYLCSMAKIKSVAAADSNGYVCKDRTNKPSTWEYVNPYTSFRHAFCGSTNEDELNSTAQCYCIAQ
ncbi:MAG: IPT/TIG domain-containing protein [Candidatus Methylumidiphilus sp.]